MRREIVHVKLSFVRQVIRGYTKQKVGKESKRERDRERQRQRERQRETQREEERERQRERERIWQSDEMPT